MRLRRILTVLLVLALPARATSYTTDATDLWWNSNESGWGLNVIQQSEVLFLTFFVYASNGAPTWYVAPDTSYSGTSGVALVFSGPLYQTNGPWFGTSFNPATVGVRQVGTATFTMLTINTASLTYSADGTGVSKSLTRQTWRTENLVGSYLGATVGTYSGCASNGYSEDAGAFVVSQNGSSISISSASSQTGVTCSYSGTYTQTGRMGVILGTESCSNGAFGQVTATEVTVSLDSLTGHVVVVNGSCVFNGRFGGLRRGS